MNSLPFRYDDEAHAYIALDTGEELQHITGMLLRTGKVDDTWFTEESSVRGSMVHDLTASYDLEALDVDGCDSPWRGYLLAHVKAMQVIKPEVLEVEVARVHPRYRYGGRPDRALRMWSRLSVLEVKTGQEDASHGIQTALQAMLLEREYNLPARAWGRYALYLRENGKYKLRECKDPADFNEAEKVIRRCC